MSANELPWVLRGSGFALVARLAGMTMDLDPAIAEVVLGRDEYGELMIWWRAQSGAATPRPRHARRSVDD